MGVIVLYVREFYYFSRTMRIGWLIGGAVIIGAGVGLWYSGKFLNKKMEFDERLPIRIFFLAAGAIFFPMFASILNRMTPTRPYYIAVELVEEKPFIADRGGILEDQPLQPSGYYLFFYYDNQLIRITNKKQWYAGKSRGDTVMIPAKTGLLGFQYIYFTDSKY